MSELEIPVQRIVKNLTDQIAQLSYESAVANAALAQARERIAELEASIDAGGREA